MKIEFLAGNIKNALTRFLQLCRTVFVWNTWYSSSNMTSAELEVTGNVVKIKSGMALPGGEGLAKCKLGRTYRFLPDMIEVREELTCKRILKHCYYSLPSEVSEINFNGDGNIRFATDRIEGDNISWMTIGYRIVSN